MERTFERTEKKELTGGYRVEKTGVENRVEEIDRSGTGLREQSGAN